MKYALVNLAGKKVIFEINKKKIKVLMNSDNVSIHENINSYIIDLWCRHGGDKYISEQEVEQILLENL